MAGGKHPRIVWSPIKAAANVRKHGVAFEEAATVFRDALLLTKPDPDHSILENRYISLGLSSLHRLILVAHTSDENEIRIISARKPTRSERHAYEED